MARQKLTSQMNLVELAKIYAEQAGHWGGHGGWIYTLNGKGETKVICQGWDAYARRLEAAGIIKAGKGIDWQHHLRGK